MKKHIPLKIRREIRAYKQMNKNASMEDICGVFEKAVGRRLYPSTIRRILKEKDEIMIEAAERAKRRVINKTATQLIKLTEQRMNYLDRIEGKIIYRLNRQLNREHIRAPELMRMQKDIHDIRAQVLGTTDVSAQISVTPEQLEKYKNFQTLIDEAIKNKQNIKLTKTIRKTRDSGTGGAEEEDSQDSQSKRRSTEQGEN